MKRKIATSTLVFLALSLSAQETIDPARYFPNTEVEAGIPHRAQIELRLAYVAAALEDHDFRRLWSYLSPIYVRETVAPRSPAALSAAAAERVFVQVMRPVEGARPASLAEIETVRYLALTQGMFGAVDVITHVTDSSEQEFVVVLSVDTMTLGLFGGI